MNKVSKLRKFSGLTQRELAKILDISLQSYSRKELGKTPFTDLEKIKLKKIFESDFPQITIDEIFFTEKVSKVEIKEVKRCKKD
ncbi:helix-turn-helix transcriptional regulator [Enterococcus mundtii]|uniref:helix-turn-helix transcriptional regulator n=1 Tax=Enterococcus mundtii TaxID=53346 RepID=UPI000CF0ACAB|nr:helix-turn-helix domain-containing protein [Enterococcus mundtii]PQC32084.1 hypothetical protein CUM97_03835 [Enterococcus mundtii]